MFPRENMGNYWMALDTPSSAVKVSCILVIQDMRTYMLMNSWGRCLMPTHSLSRMVKDQHEYWLTMPTDKCGRREVDANTSTKPIVCSLWGSTKGQHSLTALIDQHCIYDVVSVSRPLVGHAIPCKAHGTHMAFCVTVGGCSLTRTPANRTGIAPLWYRSRYWSG